MANLLAAAHQICRSFWKPLEAQTPLQMRPASNSEALCRWVRGSDNEPFNQKAEKKKQGLPTMYGPARDLIQNVRWRRDSREAERYDVLVLCVTSCCFVWSCSVLFDRIYTYTYVHIAYGYLHIYPVCMYHFAYMYTYTQGFIYRCILLNTYTYITQFNLCHRSGCL